MGIPEQIAELRAQIAALLIWKAQVEAVWPQITQENDDVLG